MKCGCHSSSLSPSSSEFESLPLYLLDFFAGTRRRLEGDASDVFFADRPLVPVVLMKSSSES